MKIGYEPKIYGILAEFDEAEKLIAAARRCRAAGYEKMQTYTPFAVEELSEIMPGKYRNWIPAIVLIGGILGGLTGFFMQYFGAVIYYPQNIGGRPLNSWQAFIPITFELTVLGGALIGALGLFILCGLPQYYHPVFSEPNFRRASQDAFFLCIKATDAKFDYPETRSFVADLEPSDVTAIFDERYKKLKSDY